MTDDRPSIDAELARAATELGRLGVGFALVGGLAVSIRGEVRLTRDIDLAIDVASDADTERVVRELGARGYSVAALVEHEDRKRLATVRLVSRSGVKVDLLAASSGIEREMVAAASTVAIEGVGAIPVASAEDLLAVKVLSVSERRPQDGIDARGLLQSEPAVDLGRVRARLALIRERGYHRDQDLDAKLDALVASTPE